MVAAGRTLTSTSLWSLIGIAVAVVEESLTPDLVLITKYAKAQG